MAVYSGLSTDDLRKEKISQKKQTTGTSSTNKANTTNKSSTTTKQSNSTVKNDLSTDAARKESITLKNPTTSPTKKTSTSSTSSNKSSVAYSYDDSLDKAYQAAISTLRSAERSAPSFTSSYDAQIKEIYDKIVNREKFQYDINSDMLYQQYARQYQNMGRLAMQDTIGQAAALTGGYGSSYGQAVGQQQYDAYLQQLNEVVPELYGMAYDVYQDEGDKLLEQYSMLRDLENEEYNRFVADREYQLALDKFNYEKEQSDREYQLALEKLNQSNTTSTTTKKTPTDKTTTGKTGSSYYNELLGAVANAKGAASKANYTVKADNYNASVKRINEDLALGLITKEEAAALKKVAMPGPR